MYPEWIFQKLADETGKLEEQLVEILAKKQFKITTAESCTGGFIAGAIVNVAGASEVFGEGYITYSDEAKKRILGVRQETLEQYGAVSEATAKEMAEGAAKIAQVEVALSATGIAGPGGGTLEKPVGLVYVGCHICGTTVVQKYNFNENRMENRIRTVEQALQLAIAELQKTDA